MEGRQIEPMIRGLNGEETAVEDLIMGLRSAEGVTGLVLSATENVESLSEFEIESINSALRGVCGAIIKTKLALNEALFGTELNRYL